MGKKKDAGYVPRKGSIRLHPNFLDAYGLTFTDLLSELPRNIHKSVPAGSWKQLKSGGGVHRDNFLALADAIAWYFAKKKEYQSAITYGMLAHPDDPIGELERHRWVSGSTLGVSINIKEMVKLEVPWYVRPPEVDQTNRADESTAGAIQAGQEERFGKNPNLGHIAEGERINASVSNDSKAVEEAELDWIIRSNNTLILPFSADHATCELQRVYTALLVDPTCLAERMAHYQLMVEYSWADSGLTPDQAHDAARGSAGIRQLLKTMDFVPEPFQGLQTIGESLTLGEAYRDFQALVVLGDPGSGKTTITRWLALTMATAWRSRDREVSVHRSQVDPSFDSADESGSGFSLGSPRFPFLIRASQFAHYLEVAPNDKKTLIEFLGHHKDLIFHGLPTYLEDHRAYSEVVPVADRTTFAKAIVREGKALVMVDGLDEVANLGVRETLRNAIDEFITLHVRRRSPQLSTDSGNQIVISSRIAGYNFCPLSQTVTHVIVQPMGRKARQFFFRRWLAAVDDATKASPENADSMANILETQIRERGSKIEAIASNPLQAGALAAVFRHNRFQLPATRIEIYRLAIQRFFDVWKERRRQHGGLIPFDDEELMVLLEDVAMGIHRMSDRASGLIERAELQTMLRDTRMRLQQGSDRKLSKRESDTLDELIAIFANDVGLLAERAEGVFGFLVLPIQEYFVAGYLARGESEHISATLRSHLDDTRFRESIVMAIAQLAQTFPKRLESMLAQFVRADQQLDDLIPTAALTAVTALSEVNWLSRKAATDVVHQLLLAYSQDESKRSEILLDIMKESLKRLHSINPELVLEAICELVANQATLAVGTAEFLLNVDHCWMTPSIAKALFDSAETDRPEQDYPIHRVLRQRSLNHLHAARPFPMRQFLESSLDSLEFLRSDPDWLRLMSMLYGGFTDYQSHVAARQYFEYSTYLQLDDGDRRQFVPQFHAKFGANDTVYAIAVYIDSGGGRLREAKDSVEFVPSGIDRESPLTQGLIRALQSKVPAVQLLTQLREIKNDPSRIEMSQDVYVALFALGDMTVIHELESSNNQVVDSVRWRLMQRRSALADSIFRLASQAPKLLELVPTSGQAERLAKCLCESIAVTTGMELLITESVPEKMLPELLVARLSGRASNDVVYHSAVFTDTHSKRLAGASTVAAILSAMSRSPTTANLNAWPWPLSSVPPAIPVQSCIPMCVIDAIQTIHSRVSFARNWLLLETLAPLLKTNPEFLPEFLAAAVCDIGEHSDDDFGNFGERFAAISRVELRTSAFELARRLASPFHAARAMLRLATCWPEEATNLISVAADCIKEISQPEQRQEVLEFGLQRFDLTDQATWFEAALKSAQSIENLDNRARSLVRLTAAAHESAREELLKAAIESAGMIIDPHQRAETLRIFGPFCRMYSKSRAELEQLINQLPNLELQEHASGNLRGAIRIIEDNARGEDLETVTHSALLTLAAATADLNLGHSVNTNKLWVNVCNNPGRETFEPLLAIGYRGGLEFSLVAALVLDRLRVVKGITWILPLLKVVQSPSPDTLAILRGWRSIEVDETKGNLFRTGATDSDVVAELKQLASLLIAESQGLSAVLIPELADLLTTTDDRIRHRAWRGFRSPSRPSYRPKLASLLGRDTIEVIAAQILKTRNPGQRLCLELSLSIELKCDVPEYLTKWIVDIDEDSTSSDVAHCVIEMLEAISENCWPVYLNGIQSHSEKVAMAFLSSLANMAECTHYETIRNSNRNSKGKTTCATLLNGKKLVDLLAVLPRLPRSHFQDLIVHRDRMESIADTVIEQTVNDEPFDLKQAISGLENRGTPLAAFLNAETPGALLDRLNSIGSLKYAPMDLKEYLADAACIVHEMQASRCVPFLIEWLHSVRVSGRREGLVDSVTDVSADLMLLLAAIATKFPNQFLQYADTKKLAPLAIKHATDNRHRKGRCASLLVLGGLRQATPAVLNVLTAAMTDSQDVVDGALRAASLLRRIHSDDLLSLIGTPENSTGLYHSSAVSSYCAARILQAVGSSPWCGVDARRTILQGLAKARRHETAQRIIQFGYSQGHLPQPPTLEEEFLRALLVVSRLNDGTAAKVNTK